MPRKNKYKTISPQKWDRVKELVHEQLKNPSSSDETCIILDDDDLKELKKKGELKYDIEAKVGKKKKVNLSIVYAREK